MAAGKPLPHPMTAQPLTSLGSNPPQWLSAARRQQIHALCLAVCAEFECQPQELFRRTRGVRRTVLARQVAMTIVRRTMDLTLQDIGHIFGDRDHGTVIHATKQVRDLLLTEPEFPPRYRRCLPLSPA